MQMIKITQEEVNEVVRLHGLWLEDSKTGKRANLNGRDLSGLDLSYANLDCATYSSKTIFPALGDNMILKEDK